MLARLQIVVKAENGRKAYFFDTLLLSGCRSGTDNVSRER